MKKIEDYLNLNYPMEVVKDADEGGYVITFPDLPGCISSGETIEMAIKNANDAKEVWLEAAIEEGIAINEPNNLEKYSGQFKLRIPKSLHKSLAENSKREGISMNQYCLYLLSENNIRHVG
ncbi:MAG: type II toxin-antitoxin system HicB family antitoxin [Lachnospiraceae bacterium]|jgi:predicted RNase H-like HicB family nuclease|nr:type II toxin-antitoxin system HicB family antitoxin [Lachnospiraceae bacterium]